MASQRSTAWTSPQWHPDGFLISPRYDVQPYTTGLHAQLFNSCSVMQVRTHDDDCKQSKLLPVST